MLTRTLLATSSRSRASCHAGADPTRFFRPLPGALLLIPPWSKSRLQGLSPARIPPSRLVQTRLSLVRFPFPLSRACSPSPLAGNAVPPAGAADQDAIPFADPANDAFVTTTPAGVPVATTTTAAPTEPEKTDPAPPAAPPKPPLYKRRWFIITSVLGACLAIALLFIILYPVLKAIIQDVVNKTTLDITTAAITSPTNTSYVSPFRLYIRPYPLASQFPIVHARHRT